MLATTPFATGAAPPAAPRRSGHAHAARGVAVAAARRDAEKERPLALARAVAMDASVALCAPQSRRDILARACASGALLLSAGCAAPRARAENAEAPAAALPELVTADGEGWSIQYPSDFQREVVSPVLEAPSTTIGAAPRALPGFGPAPPENPLKLRLISPGAEVVSLGVRRAADLRPTFLQVNDIADFGSLEEVASLLVPPGATLLSSATATHTVPSPTDDAEPVPRSYYTYEFRRGALNGVLVAAAKRGKTYVVIATKAARELDDAAAARLRSVAGSFRVLG